MDLENLKVERRTGTGKGVARKLRQRGQIPAILYGEGESIPVMVEPKSLLRVLGTAAGENVILNLTVVGGEELTRNAMVKEVQVDPVTGTLLHADLFAISLERPIEVEVPVELVGVATGAKEKEGIVEQILRELKVRCLPRAIPDRIELDVTPLDIGDVLHVKDLPIPEGVELLTDPDQVVVTVAAAAVEVEEVAAPAVEAEEVAAAAAEGAPAKEGAAKDKESGAKPASAPESTARAGPKTPPKKE